MKRIVEASNGTELICKNRLIGVVYQMTHLTQKWFFRAMPADVRKGCAFPSISLQVLRLRLRCNALKVRRSLPKQGEATRKGTAFPHIGRHSRKIR